MILVEVARGQSTELAIATHLVQHCRTAKYPSPCSPERGASYHGPDSRQNKTDLLRKECGYPGGHEGLGRLRPCSFFGNGEFHPCRIGGDHHSQLRVQGRR